MVAEGPRLRLQPAPSVLLLGSAVALHLLALLALLISAVPWWAVSLLLPALLFSAVQQLRLALLTHPRSVRLLRVDRRGIWLDTTRGCVAVRLCPGVFRGPALQVLRLRRRGRRSLRERLVGNGRYTLVVTPDNVEADIRRRLCRWLIWEAGRDP